MKTIKRLMLCLVLLICTFLVVGCDDPDDPPVGGDTDVKIEDVKDAVAKVFSEYEEAEHAKVQVIIANGSDTSTLDLVYNFEEGKYGISSLASIFKDSDGELSCYVEDGKAYMNRYDTSKTVVKVTETESETIAATYGFDAYTRKVKLILGSSFFTHSEIKSFKDDVVEVELNLGTYVVESGDYDDEELESICGSLKEKDSVKAYITYKDNAVSGVKVEIVGSTTATLEVKFLGVSTSDIEIEFPDFDDYK